MAGAPRLDEGVPVLMGIGGPAVGLSIAVRGDTLILGREHGGAPELAQDPALSRTHAMIRRDNAGLILSDLNSHNGTWLNGQPVRESSRLRYGDEIQLGSSVFRLVAPASSRRGRPQDVDTTPRGARPNRDSGGVRFEGNVSLAERSIMAGRDITGDITTYEDHHWDYDPTGLQGARGFARVLLVVSLLLGVAGFGFFGYSIVGGLIAFGQDWAAQSECREQFGLGEALFDCLDSVGSGGLPFEVTPWIPIGAVLFFASIVLQVAGRAMNRNTDEHHRPGSPPRPGP